ncbi:MAG: pyruvate kinase [Nitrososphaerales archaeon]
MGNQATREDELWAGPVIKDLITELESVRSAALLREASLDLGQFGDHLQSARNLVHYLALRRFELRGTQERLAALGVSSLGRSEGHVLTNLDVVLAILYRLAGLAPPKRVVGGVTPSEGSLILERNAASLLGPRGKGRGVRIMVTMPQQAATDYGLVRDLLASGMDCMRINCAHDSESDWTGMISNLRLAEKEVGRTCRILMDIAGPKLRTGPLKPGPQVVRVRPKRDVLGRVVRPARVWLTPSESREQPPEPAEATLPLPREFLVDLVPRAVLSLRDARGSRRALRVESRIGGSFWASCGKTAYVMKGTVLSSSGKRARVGDLPHIIQPISLKVGDTLAISGRRIEGADAVRDAGGRVRRWAVISCTIPQALAAIRRGQPIWFDDGKIGGVVISASSKQVNVRITSAAGGGSELRGDKGINLPKTELSLPPLTRKDISDLEFVAKHADLVGYSFMKAAGDVDLLQSMLTERGRADMGIVLKIETLRAFEALPSILLAAMRAPLAGVMIARGDLAVECGYERLSEVQEEILWLCEAAHMPTIWATQVLERLTKSGIPSRAEVTDAAMGERAECVMLNKGPYMVEAVKALDNILERMQTHHSKKSSLLRHLHIAESFFESPVSGRRTSSREPRPASNPKAT